ncbi:MAG TPA: response regulator [Methanoregula sp.]|nr:response regulator [Methanoregula sp.]
MSGLEAVSVLCVDDEALLLEVFEDFFKREPGFSITTCANATEALEKFSAQSFDAILADYGLPDMDGINLLKEIRAGGFSGLFIIITGKHRAHVAIDALNNGADYYVQKGGGMVNDMAALVEFIREGVGKIRANQDVAKRESLYRSIVENNSDLLCSFLKEGEIRFVNNSYANFVGKSKKECIGSNFYSFVPAAESKNIGEQLHNLVPSKPDIILEHPLNKSEGTSPIIQWNYRALFNQDGEIIEYQTAGREQSGFVRSAEPHVSKIEGTLAISAPAAMTGAEPEDDWRTFSHTIDNLESPVFAIDKTGVIITWNKAMEQLTGFSAKEMVGKGKREYAIPFYGEPRPMLVDYIVISTDKRQSGKFPGIKRSGNTFTSEMEKVKIRDKPMCLWGKGTAVYDSKGGLIAAIETITVVEQQHDALKQGELEKETYIGGLSSPTLKVAGGSASGAIAGLIPSPPRGYGIYATNKRLFVIQNPDFDLSKPKGMQYGPYVLDDLFGTRTTIDSRPKTIDTIEKLLVYEIAKQDLVTIELMNPVLLPGFLTMYNKTGESFRMFIDHKTAFLQIEHLIKTFYPEILRLE